MNPDFSTILSNLRRESSLSQKKAADDLGISQALLSHYENGVREPKLEFIVRACDYYGVSTDYILGRTPERAFGGVSLQCRTENDRRIVASAALLLSMLADLGDDALCEATAHYVHFSLFVIQSALRAKKPHYEPLFDAAMKTAEAAFIERARRATSGRARWLSDETLCEMHPEQFEAILEVEKIVNSAVSSLKQSSIE